MTNLEAFTAYTHASMPDGQVTITAYFDTSTSFLCSRKHRMIVSVAIGDEQYGLSGIPQAMKLVCPKCSDTRRIFIVDEPPV